VKVDNRVYADRSEYIIKDVAKRRKKIRLMAVQHAGGKCVKCGYFKCLDVLEFHHKDPSKKLFGIGQNKLTRSWESVKAEIEKCDLLCANCHREIHAEQNKQLNQNP
jgi:5-methylcytosine-specific restriction endonuclease McrA